MNPEQAPTLQHGLRCRAFSSCNKETVFLAKLLMNALLGPALGGSESLMLFAAKGAKAFCAFWGTKHLPLL